MDDYEMIFPPQGYKNISYKWLNQGMIFRPHGSYSEISLQIYFIIFNHSGHGIRGTWWWSDWSHGSREGRLCDMHPAWEIPTEARELENFVEVLQVAGGEAIDVIALHVDLVIKGKVCETKFLLLGREESIFITHEC